MSGDSLKTVIIESPYSTVEHEERNSLAVVDHIFLSTLLSIGELLLKISGDISLRILKFVILEAHILIVGRLEHASVGRNYPVRTIEAVKSMVGHHRDIGTGSDLHVSDFGGARLFSCACVTETDLNLLSVISLKIDLARVYESPTQTLRHSFGCKIVPFSAHFAYSDSVLFCSCCRILEEIPSLIKCQVGIGVGGKVNLWRDEPCIGSPVSFIYIS